jgi:hypothetical protein
MPAMALASLFLLDGCVSQPMGPMVAVMPAPGKLFAAFQEDQAICKQFAGQETQGAAERANNQQIGTAAVGTVLGAAVGAGLGGGRGAAAGAGLGALGGTVVGGGGAARAGESLQTRYDIAYSQCMAARGNVVPGYQAAVPPPPPPGYPPQPGSLAPGYPPPGAPPPGYGVPGYGYPGR